MSSHFGPWISAYADGQLPSAKAERLEAHILVCAACSRELGDERRARSLLLAARDVAPGPDLAARILAGAPPASAAHPTQRRECHPDLRPDTGSRSFPALTGDLRRRRRTRRWVAVSAVVVGCGVIGLSELGRPPLVNPDTAQASALDTLSLAPVRGVVGIAATTGSDDVLARLRREGWILPSALPDGVSLAHHAVRGDVLEIDLDTPSGAVVVIERRGTLADALAQHPAVDVEGHTVYVLTTEPWHVVTQVGDVVVELYAPGDGEPARDVLASLEGHASVGIVSRVSHGWSVLTEEISR
ncbi:anti-sigma factor family protein [Sanguibacter sp. A247]|uniref:anti-sigma factor family protein n=1 Tax=unclassified Sanguibacter TaxID=2645534 RepID=UPI003FD89C6B